MWRFIRERVSQLLQSESAELRDNAEHRAKIIVPQSSVQMHMPVEVPDYTDFYSSREHATNVGIMFRGKDNALMPNWLHIPVGYHGRSSTIIVSGTPIQRPCGQVVPKDAELPIYSPSRLLDFELEMAFITGKENTWGTPITTDNAEEHIFGMVLFNDWSARDIQKWEYVPLGPFLGKSFASSISPWIVTLDALEPLRTSCVKQEPEVLPYLQCKDGSTFDINLDVLIQPEGSSEHHITRSNYKHLYWNMAQQLAHQSINGCKIRVGDMYASGTISGPTKDSYGSMLELTWRGENPISMPDGSERKFIQDHDTVIMRGFGESESGLRIGFGEVTSKVLPAAPMDFS
jgi:fumarylacetoacetase